MKGKKEVSFWHLPVTRQTEYKESSEAVKKSQRSQTDLVPGALANRSTKISLSTAFSNGTSRDTIFVLYPIIISF